MKKCPLTVPYQWENRHVALQPHVLFIPSYYSQYGTFSFPPWHESQIFGNHNPVCIEYCSGNGEWIAHKAEENPNYNWVAVEKFLPRCKLIFRKIEKSTHKNLFLVSGPAEEFTLHYVPSASVEKVYINFPDPWPKNRHAKHRLLQEPFVQQLQRILKPQGQICFVTDDLTYMQQAVHLFLQCTHLQPIDSAPFYVVGIENYGSSYFETLWKRQNREIYFLRLSKHER